MNTALVSLLDYSGKELKWLNVACQKISQVVAIEKTSSIYIDEFEKGGREGGRETLVAALRVTTDDDVFELWQKLKDIETSIHSEATHEVIKIILLTFASEIIMTPQTTIPHPKLHLFPQLLLPACEIMPNFQHPVLQKKLIDISHDIEKKWGRFFAQGSKLLDF